MTYSKKVLQHFKHPKNQGVIKNADAVGKVGNPVCGDVMKIYLKIAERGRKKEKYIKDIKFETLGCAAAISVSSILTEMVKGKSLTEALKVSNQAIVKELGGLPAPKIHCSMLGTEALRQAIKNYELKISNSNLQK
jgi:nitrogen fixation NifU-like protein